MIIRPLPIAPVHCGGGGVVVVEVVMEVVIGVVVEGGGGGGGVFNGTHNNLPGSESHKC